MLFGSLQTLLVLLLGLALADPRIQKSSDRVNLFFCLDVSQSIGRQAEKQAKEFMTRAVKAMQAEDRAGLILFGKEAFLESQLQRDPDLSLANATVDKNATNIYEALQLAIGKLPHNGQDRIVLLSDGNENMKEAADMALLAKSLNIQIFTVPLASWFRQNEIYVEALEAPQQVALSTPFEIRAVIVSTRATPGEWVLFRNDRVLASQSLKFQAGKNVIRLKDELKEPGLFRYRVVVRAADDTLFQNNEGLAFVSGARKGVILYVAESPTGYAPLAQALTAQGLNLIRLRKELLPRSLFELAPFDAIILDNVDGRQIPFQTMQNIENYVKDLGGGLVMIGGEKSFGAGHYLKTPVEKALPVYMDVPTDLELSGICIVLVIDKSSSMTATYDEKSKLEMAKIAAFATVELLNPVDSVGIVAFDTAFRWAVPITRVIERKQIADRLTELKEGGGTDLYPPLQDVHRVLQEFKAAKKHVIVLSDGMTEKGDFKTLVTKMLGDRITVSTVSVGSGADIQLMRHIAQWGGGRAYFTEDPNNIPRIFTDETKIVSKKLLVEKQMKPRMLRPADLLRGISADLPPVGGQVLTYPKPEAQVLIDTEEGPLLAVTQYGLGRSAAFTSDFIGRWGKAWIRWPQFGRFAAQMVRWTQREPGTGFFQPTISKKGGQGSLVVDIVNQQNRFVNQLDLKLKVLFPSGRDQVAAVSQIAPGRYQGFFPAEEIGDYYLNLYEADSANAAYAQVFGFGVPYSEEFVSREVNADLLARLSGLSKGKLLAVDSKDLGDLFRAEAGTKEYGGSLWPLLTLLFLIDLAAIVALRKLWIE
jgi:uncharacterized membrane protein